MTTIELMTWGLAGLSLTGVVLNIHKKRACFAIWTVTNFCWMAYDFSIGAYAQSALFAIYFVLAVWGTIKWKTDGGDNV